MVRALSFIYPFDRTFMRLALVAGIAVGMCAPLIGTFLVQRRLSLLGDGVGHLAFAGVAAGVFAGVWPIWTALIAAVAGAVVVELMRARSRSSGDLALALVFYSGIAGGSVLLNEAGSGSSNLSGYLFGSILTVDRSDVLTIVVLAAVVVVIVTVVGPALFTVLIDEDAARVAGLPVSALNLLLAVLTAVIVVAAMRVVGLLLVSALMVMPVGAAQQWARSFRSLLVGSSAIGLCVAVGGLGVARVVGWPPGGTIVLLAALVFAVSAVLAPRVRR